MKVPRLLSSASDWEHWFPGCCVQSEADPKSFEVLWALALFGIHFGRISAVVFIGPLFEWTSSVPTNSVGCSGHKVKMWFCYVPTSALLTHKSFGHSQSPALVFKSKVLEGNFSVQNWHFSNANYHELIHQDVSRFWWVDDRFRLAWMPPLSICIRSLLWLYYFISENCPSLMIYKFFLKQVYFLV